MTLNILLVSASVFPSRTANSVQVVRMAEAMAVMGHRVTVTGYGAAANSEIADWYGLNAVVRFENKGLSTVPILRIFENARRTRRIATRLGTQIAYGRDPIGLLGTVSSQIPSIYEVHHPPTTRARAVLEKRLIGSHSFLHVVAISHRLADVYRQAHPRVSVLVAHDAAVDPGPPKISARRPVVGYVGSLHAGKGSEFVLEIARRLPATRFEIYGGEPSQIRHLARSAPSNVDILGHKPPSDIPRVLASLSVALAPYQDRVFGSSRRVDLSEWMSPLKIFEYLAHGLPIVATDLPVIREVLTSGEDAILLPAGDVDKWAWAIQSITDDPERMAQMSVAARRSFEGGHRWVDRVSVALGGAT